MSEKILVSIYDKKAESFGEVLNFNTKGVAIREIGRTVNTDGNLLNSNPEDFELYQVGTFNSEKGTIKEKMEKIIEIKELKNSVEK